ncbi:hypothetical protein A5821_002005 [Enterococcus sp. 7F3_DIV0205]|uniref:Uncharacterized protein n=1 Tax=Candidatus Enterococcus palustris TaxID=1834189 RepID=A0AAQ3Y7C8_9ENTE|nr:hypothetical protein [Enterococcus sp. 7F3_DIV0205]OTN82444.1 hypothetical protein A5821_002355 [Enterococcus sp. 7F3_DIV0205]
MAHKLREEWDKLFSKKHDLEELKKAKHDESGNFVTDEGEGTEVLGHSSVDELNAMMYAEWNTFLNDSTLFTALEEAEQNKVRSNGPSFAEYNGD